MMTLSVRENAALVAPSNGSAGAAAQPRSRGGRRRRRELDSLEVKTPSAESVVSALSGGNQQKVVLARALLSRPQILARRRTHAGRRRRGAGGDLPDPA